MLKVRSSSLLLTCIPKKADTDTLGSPDAQAFKDVFRSAQQGNVLDAVEDKKEEKNRDEKEEAPSVTEDKKEEAAKVEGKKE